MMATKFVRPFIKEENMEISLIPPGFESFANLNVMKTEDIRTISNSPSTSASVSHIIQMQTQVESMDRKTTRPRRRRSDISYKQFDDCSGDEFDSDKNRIGSSCLPKGVIRGCKDCSNCQTVTAKWRPEEACRPDLENAPIFHPTEEEFEDPIAYIASIRPRAEKYGICRIVPPPSWKPPCPLEEKNMWEKSNFQTRVQKVDKLQNRKSVKNILMASDGKKKRRRCSKNVANFSGDGACEAEYFGFEPGPEFTMQSFQKYADDFKGQYFRKDGSMTDLGSDDMAINQDSWEPSVENIEGEYWRVVEKPTEELEVLYGADLETGVFGSGFLTDSKQGYVDSDEKYVKSGWNLNNFPRLPGSILSYESSDISGVLVPWLYIGMCFSSFCWHVEDHYMYSLNYMHWGSPKLWYGVPGEEADKLEAAMRKHLPDLFEEQPDLLHKLVTQLSPTILKREGVPVYRCVQNSGEFVLTFPRAYHSGFNCGFNCAEAVNVAPVDWLPHGFNAIEHYRKQGRKTSISHDKLLLGAAREAVKAHWEVDFLKKNISANSKWKSVCGRDGILSKTLEARIEMERVRRESLCISSHTVKMNSNFDAAKERECCVCLFDLHLSAVGCHCSPERYTCLYHANHLCSCSSSAKFYLFRYDANELNILVDAVEGKLSAVYRWSRLDLGLSLSTQTSKVPEEKSPINTTMQEPKIIVEREFMDNVPNSCETKGRGSRSKEQMKVEAVLALEAVKLPSALPKIKVKLGNYSSVVKKKSANLETSVLHISQIRKASLFHNDNIILLSDDESEVSKSAIFGKEKQASAVIVDSSQGVRGTDDTMSASKAMGSTSAGGGSVKCEMLSESDPIDPFSYRVSTFNQSDEGTRNSSKTAGVGDGNIKDDTIGSPCGNKVLDSESRHKIKIRTNLILSKDVNNISCFSPNNQIRVDQYFRQKGPRIAKVVRKISCNVEPLEYGVVHSGKFWCDDRAIFPVGFKSHVKYINMLDPTSMCYYVSEVLDGGLDRPLFMVSLENYPNEVFVHVSADKCWDMVRERVNQEIVKQHKLGKTKLHPLQPPNSLDGLEMFGFSSPAIVQVIQAMDKNQVCTEYWKSRPIIQMSQNTSSECNTAKPPMTDNIFNEQKPNQSCSTSAKVDLVFGQMLNKANPEELEALYNILGDEKSTSDRGLVSEFLNREIHQRQR